MWELDHKKCWEPKNCCFQIVVLEKTLESPLDSKEIKLVNPKGNQPWIFTRITEAEVLILWPPDLKSWLIEKTLVLGNMKNKKRREWQRMRWLNSITDSKHMNLRKLWDSGRQRSLACCSPCGCRVGHDLMTYWTTAKSVSWLSYDGSTGFLNSFSIFKVTVFILDIDVLSNWQNSFTIEVIIDNYELTIGIH